MKILLNEKPLEVREGQTLRGIAALYKPDADILIWNGFPVSEDVMLEEGDRVVLIQRGEKPKEEELEALLVARHTPGIHGKLKSACVGIAGAGGLGSFVAMALARVGIGRLIIADHDRIEPSNLNRQQYFVDQIGEFKVDALKVNIRRANPYVHVEVHKVVLKEENILKIFRDAKIVVEAFDRVEMKVMISEVILKEAPGKYLIMGSGLAGFGPNNEIKTRRVGNLFICGDERSEAKPGQGLMAPRVGIAAHHQANQVLRILLCEEKEL